MKQQRNRRVSTLIETMYLTEYRYTKFYRILMAFDVKTDRRPSNSLTEFTDLLNIRINFYV